MRYRENIYKQEFEHCIVAFNDIIDLVNEAKRKSKSKSAHKVLDHILSIVAARKESASELLDKKMNREY